MQQSVYFMSHLATDLDLISNRSFYSRHFDLKIKIGNRKIPGVTNNINIGSIHQVSQQA